MVHLCTSDSALMCHDEVVVDHWTKRPLKSSVFRDVKVLTFKSYTACRYICHIVCTKRLSALGVYSQHFTVRSLGFSEWRLIYVLIHCHPE